MGEELFNFFLKILSAPADFLLFLAEWLVGWQTGRAMRSFYSLLDGNMRYIAGVSLYIVLYVIPALLKREAQANRTNTEKEQGERR